MAVSIVAGSTVVANGVAIGVTATTSVTPTLPTGSASGDRVFIFADAVATIPTPTDWTLLSTSSVGSGTQASGAGVRTFVVFYRDYDGAWSMPTVTADSIISNAIAGAAVTMRKGSTETWDTPTFTIGNDTTSGTGYSATGSSITSPDAAGVLLATGISAIVTTASATFTQAGATFASLVNSVVSGGTTAGFRADVVAYTTTVTTGATAAPTHACTLGTARTGGTVFTFQTASPGGTTYAGDAAVTANATVTADGFVTAASGAILIVTAAVNAVGFRSAESGAAIATTAAVTATGATTIGGSAAVTATATTTAGGSGSWGPPANIVATPISGTRVDLSWDAVPTATGYRIWRDNVVVAANATGTTYSDLTVSPATSYSYEMASIR